MLRGLAIYLLILFKKKDKAFYRRLLAITGQLPIRISLYRTAFTHKSASVEKRNGEQVNNERLEFLGDALLGAAVTEYIYKEFNDKGEGYMTKLRSRIVKRKHLNDLAIQMGIPALVNSHPHPATESKHLYGNALEALIGAIYLDRGYNAVTRFFRKQLIQRHIDLVSITIKDSDYKSQLVEWAQKNRKEVVFLSREGHDMNSHVPTFESVVLIDQVEAGTGRGDSKKEAEQQAAMEAISTLF